MTTTTITPDKKIIDILKEDNGGKPFVSLEYFPPRTDEGVKNLHARMDRMRETLKPAFTDITWGAGGSTAGLSMDLALYMKQTGHVANLHMTCTNIQGETDPKGAVLKALKQAHDGGIRNIVALRGDPQAGQEEWKASEGGFTCALDLVEFIRKEFGADFGISVAGYPEGHPNAISEVADASTLSETEQKRASQFNGKTYCCLDADYKKEMDYLKKKVDAGADLIITQMFFDADTFLTFVDDCRKWGIECPVVPGLMCINNYGGFCKMTEFCKTRVPTSLQQSMDAIKGDADAIKAFGIEFGTQVCKKLVDSGKTNVLHFYTLNLEKVVYGVLDGLGLSDNASAVTDEKDAASQVAKGSAWARIGDKVTTPYGKGIVLELNQTTGAAKIEIENWKLAGGQSPIAFLQKAQFQKAD